MNHRFSKAERINSEIIIKRIFSEGKSLFSHPFRIVWVENLHIKDTVPVEILISVSKRKFKRAVDRNQVKRFIRESYRLNKNLLLDFCAQKDLNIQLAIVYVAKEVGDFDYYNKSMIKMLNKIIIEIEKPDKK